ncbi:hypothetical protein [Streptomyces thioluteus]|uniref:hypothetical protein n=1 Tax=Streptomyces thioluteus TaxID=66431 RepID=UPI0031F130FE
MLAGKKRLRKSGKDRYETDIRVHLEPRIGHLRLDRLRVQQPRRDVRGHSRDEHRDQRREHHASCRDRRAGRDPWKGAESRARRKALKETIAAMPPFRRITGPSTQSHIRATLRAALNDAIAQGYITFNPAQHVELEAAKRRRLVWTGNASKNGSGRARNRPRSWCGPRSRPGQFLDFIAEDRLYALFHLITYRGLRREVRHAEPASRT